ncbi:MAG: hypothetical protein WAK44_12320, partial [Trebonia sp.]|uniref:hypothetical protein n=1 Tax=Trebonia sp. TaxID=2767075 RepID=UPI003BB004B7
MSRIKRWMDRRRVVWSEPALPKYIKINPNSPPGAAEGLQPGDMSMLKVAEEFLEEPEEGLALSGLGALPDVRVRDRPSGQHVRSATVTHLPGFAGVGHHGAHGASRGRARRLLP